MKNLLENLETILTATEAAADVLLNSDEYKNDSNAKHADAVNNYNKLVTMNLNAAKLKNSILNL